MQFFLAYGLVTYESLITLSSCIQLFAILKRLLMLDDIKAQRVVNFCYVIDISTLCLIIYNWYDDIVPQILLITLCAISPRLKMCDINEYLQM